MWKSTPSATSTHRHIGDVGQSKQTSPQKCQIINQSINQSIKFLLLQYPWARPGSVVRQVNHCAIAKLMKHFNGINRLPGVPVSKGDRPSQRDVSSDVSWRLQLKRLNGQTAAGCSRETGHKSEKLWTLNWSWTVFRILLASSAGNEAVEHCAWQEVTFCTQGPCFTASWKKMMSRRYVVPW